AIGDEFAVTAIAHPGLARSVPQISRRRFGNAKVTLGEIGILCQFVMAITERPEFLDEIRGIRSHRPLMPIGADFAFNVKIIEQDKFFGEFMMVGRHIRWEQTEAWIAISFM